MTLRCAILDDYQNVALTMADWSEVTDGVEIKVFNRHLGSADNVVSALQGFAVVCAMRERTPFPRAVIERLPDLRLLITSGMRNASIDLGAAKDHGVLVCGTESFGNGTVAIATGLMIDLARRISYENARLKAGAPWQTTIGLDLEGMTLALLGLGRLGARMADIGRAFKMNIIAWSENLTDERCRAAGAAYVHRDDLFRRADFLCVHLQLSERTRGLIGARELGLMKPTAFLINTSRGPIVEEAALLAALREKRIAGAGLDVFDIEPLPLDHPFRALENVLLTPHLGYVTEQNYRTFFAGMVEDIRAFLDGKPLRTLG
jgi:phosphoglycerate dehydrogenase-like enzyme